MTSVGLDTVHNRLLTALPIPILTHLQPQLRRVEMPLRTTILEADRPVAVIHFPDSGLVSLLMPLEDGTVAEVGLVGAEGLVGLNAVLGASHGMMSGLVQAPGFALAIDTAFLRQAMEDFPALRRLLMRYAVAFNMQVAMTAACNIRHPLKKRLARWLLMSHDRAGGDEFPMTHEFLSLMLGVRRAGVSIAAAALRQKGLIQYRQGRVRIMDRAALERASCGCDRLARSEFDRLPGPGGD